MQEIQFLLETHFLFLVGVDLILIGLNFVFITVFDSKRFLEVLAFIGLDRLVQRLHHLGERAIQFLLL